MTTFHLLYQSDEQVKQFVNKPEFNEMCNYFVRIHYCGTDCEKAVQIAKSIKEVLPTATIAGVSASGVIYNGEIFEEDTLISFVGFENARIIHNMIPENGADATQLAESIATLESGFEPALAFLFYGRLNHDVSKIAAILEEKIPSVPFVGGAAGFFTEEGQIASFIFNETGYLKEGASVTYISKEYVLAYVNAVVGHAPISEPHTITKATKDYIDEIDGEPAVDWLYNHLGIQQMRENSDWATTTATDILLRFPFVLEGQDGASRFIQYEAASNRIKLYFSELYEGQQFKIGYLSPLQSAEEWQEVCCDLQVTPAETLFCYSCVFRKLYLKNLAKWEMRPFKNDGICGAFLMGEVGSKHTHTHHYNGSCVFFTMAEKENYINLDLHAFDSIAELQEESEELIEQLSHVQNKLGNHENKQLLNSLINSENQLKDRVLFENQLGLTSMTEYIQKQATHRYKKICLIKFEEYDKKIDEIGFDAYQNATYEFLTYVRNFLADKYTRFEFQFFNYNIGSFFFVANHDVNDAEFIQVTQALYNKFNQLSCDKNHMYCKNSFVVTLRGGNIQDLWDTLESPDSASEPSTQLKVYDPSHSDMSDLLSDFKTVAAIKFALENDKVIPFFQGVYDNQHNCFYFYEALMRLQDEDGKMMLPSEFMHVAKKYNLYESLSICMVQKVLDLFADRKERVSINVSALDVLSLEFQNALMNKLAQIPSADHFIFELVETERFEDTEVLREFIWQIKKYGVEIAVDDFGSGYSNFVELGNLDIDYIKISGTLIQLLGTDTSYDKIFQSIQYLSKNMQVDLVAECVETVSMQKRLVESGVRFSQGFLFSSPMSFEELQVTSSNHLEHKQTEQNNTGKFNKEGIVDSNTKKIGLTFLWGGLIVFVLALLATFLFEQYTSRQVNGINDAYLSELATSMADKISVIVDDSSSMLLTVKSVITANSLEIEEMQRALEYVGANTGFDNLYLTTDNQELVSMSGDVLDVGEQSMEPSSTNEDTYILSPITDGNTDRQLILLGTPIYDGEELVATLYGGYYLDSFSTVLNLKSFGSDAFFHLCEVDGTPLILSGNSNNLFVSGDMYTFIDSLDMQNGHTSESLYVDMLQEETSLLKYAANGEERTAVMTTVPGTSWCVVSIVLNETTEQMISNIQMGTLIFSLCIILILVLYFILTFFMVMRGRKELIRALESSYFLTNSLQTSMETDSLTRTYSRATATEKIAEAIARAEAGTITHALIIMDVDNFKHINDTYGHQTGDVYLQEFVSAIKSGLRSGDIIGRLGGDEFILLLSDIPSKDVAKKVLDRIFDNVQNISIQNTSLEKVGVSAGLVMVPQDGQDYDTLNNKADQALYAAKKSGKNKYIIFGE